MLYPMTFKPILKKIIWGGSDICPFKGITPVEEGIGESWELSHVEDNYSVVDNGAFEGKTLDELIRTYGKQLLGEKVVEQFGSTFPLLIKFIDARDDLSIQVHPDDELAKKRHNSFGKTEMWYVINAAKGAGLYSGFSKQIDADEYVKRVGDNTIMDVLQRYDVNPGDVFFLPAGRVHAFNFANSCCRLRRILSASWRTSSSLKSSRRAISPIVSMTTTVKDRTVRAANCIPNWQRMRSIILCIRTTVPITRHIRMRP
jgi:mannose-6-phosphate isomerase